MVLVGRSFQDWQLTKSSIPERFKELLSLSQWTDCEFSVGSEEAPEVVRCHKLVLAVSSPVFEAMFYGDLADSSKIIRLTDIDPYSFKLFLKYIYSDSLDVSNVEEAGSLLYIGKKYMMPHLSKICLDYLIEHTYLQNLWDVLYLAESLNEDALINPCLKVMCRHSPDIWMVDEEHLSEEVFIRYLEQPQMVISELDLWVFTLNWLERECVKRKLEGTNENKRSILLGCGLLKKIRFSILSDVEFNKWVINSGLLIDEEIQRIRWSHQVTPKEDLVVPYSDCSITSCARLKPFEVRFKSSRDVIRRGNLEYYSGPLVTKVLSTGRILVCGFDVFTRSAKSSAQYIEQFSVTISGPCGTVLNQTKQLPTTSLMFNSEHQVVLSQPVWFEPLTEYSVTFDINGGLYQACTCTDTTMAKVSLSTFFKFIDPTINGERNGLTKLSFISGVLFAL